MERNVQAISVVIFNDHGSIKGGADHVALHSALALRQQGFKVCYFSGEPLSGPWKQQFDKSGIEAADLGISDARPGVHLRSLWNLSAYRIVKSFLRERRRKGLVLSHLHSLTKCLTFSVLTAATRHSDGCFLTMHDLLTFCPNSVYYHFGRQGVCRLVPLSAACLGASCDRRSYPYKLLRVVRFVLNRALVNPLRNDRLNLIGVSRKSSELCRSVTGVLPATILNPLRLIKQAPAKPWQNQHALYVGRVAPEKGVYVLARAAREAAVPLRFIGDGESRASLSIEFPEFSFSGWLSSPEVVAEVRRARCLVLPSLCYETFGLAVVEALAQGVPVIVSSNAGACDFIRPGTNGYIWEVGNEAKLSEYLTFLTDDRILERMSEEAYEHYWSSPLDLQEHGRKLADHYAETLIQKGVE